ncbi:MAG: dTDP-glucose 4,6-dehydratase [Actinobacteria bacterium]|nr:dTDP-glucose 4,6-dehydratase [Actinomycetota bacterium]
MPTGKAVVVALLVTGAAGFIGSNLVRHLLQRWPDQRLVSFDLLTYAGHLANLADVIDHPRHRFLQGDIADREAVAAVFDQHDIDGVIHLAAESHVDRSILDPMAFVRTNVAGTVVLLQEATRAWGDRQDVRFHHVSTDEVFGALGSEGFFDEDTRYRPNSPYSASKAASDHFVRAWHETYGLPAVITNCTNNYGPYQFPEKLIPVVITRALAGEKIPVYGRGENVRDWLFVEDHCDAIGLVFERGTAGETYCIGGETEATNLELVRLLLDLVDAARGADPGTSAELIEFVTDRPGHDFRYAMDITRMRSELGWSPSVSLREGLARTVEWYLDHRDWMADVQGSGHREFTDTWYEKR